MKQKDMPASEPARAIVKGLNTLTYGGISQSTVFSDWLWAVETGLTALPGINGALRESGQMPADTDAVAAQWKRLHERYGGMKVLEVFGEAKDVLLTGAYDEENQWTYTDYLGEIYEAWAWPNANLAQFFTPNSISRLMALLVVGDGEAEALERVADAYIASPSGAMHVVLRAEQSNLVDAEVYCRDFAKSNAPGILSVCAGKVMPITVNEPCVGSGVMLLAVASQYPRWAIDYGLVQFSGQDIDATCVSMARINCMVYGLNGFYIRCLVDCERAELQAEGQPPAIIEAYDKAMAAIEDDHPEQVAVIANDLRAQVGSQQSLFG